MISVVIPTLNAEKRLPICLEALVPAAIDGLVKEVVIVDGGSIDKTLEIAEGFGATILNSTPGRGGQLLAGAEAARGDWLLFLHGDTVLEYKWASEAASFMKAGLQRAGVFRLRFDAKGIAPKIVAAGAMIRTQALKSPYGDQGLLIAKSLYEELGGYADIPLMEDVEFVRRLVRAKGRSALQVLFAHAVTSAERYERDGYLRRVVKNMGVLARYHLGASPERLAERYNRQCGPK